MFVNKKKSKINIITTTKQNFFEFKPVRNTEVKIWKEKVANVIEAVNESKQNDLKRPDYDDWLTSEHKRREMPEQFANAG